MQRQGRAGIDPELFAPSASGSGRLQDADSKNSVAGGFYNGNFPTSTGWGQSAAYGSRAGGNQSEQEPAVLATLELEHMTGFTGKNKGTVLAHPTDPDGYITWWENFRDCLTMERECISSDLCLSLTCLAWGRRWFWARFVKATARNCCEVMMKRSIS